MHRLHWSKVRLAKFTPSVDPICDRCRQMPATLSHMFWFCSKLEHFWHSIFKTFSDVLQAPMEPSAITVIFGITPHDTHLSRPAKNMIAFASLIARWLTLLKWKDKLPPTFKMWMNDLLHHYSTRGSIQKLMLMFIFVLFLTIYASECISFCININKKETEWHADGFSFFVLQVFDTPTNEPHVVTSRHHMSVRSARVSDLKKWSTTQIFPLFHKSHMIKLFWNHQWSMLTVWNNQQ